MAPNIAALYSSQSHTQLNNLSKSMIQHESSGKMHTVEVDVNQSVEKVNPRIESRVLRQRERAIKLRGLLEAGALSKQSMASSNMLILNGPSPIPTIEQGNGVTRNLPQQNFFFKSGDNPVPNRFITKAEDFLAVRDQTKVKLEKKYENLHGKKLEEAVKPNLRY